MVVQAGTSEIGYRHELHTRRLYLSKPIKISDVLAYDFMELVDERGLRQAFDFNGYFICPFFGSDNPFRAEVNFVIHAL